MNKTLKIFMLLFLAAFGLSASAQDEAEAKCNDWYVRVGASVNLFMGEDDYTTNMGHRLSPSGNITVGKWFNPYWGLQLGGNFGNLRGATLLDEHYSTGEKVEHTYGETGKYGSFYEKFKFFTVQPEVVYNVSNGICGYRENRIWNVMLHAGPSIGHSFANGENQTTVFLTAGLTSQWRISSHVAFWVDTRFTMFGKKFDKQTYRSEQDCDEALSAGISINFGK